MSRKLWVVLGSVAVIGAAAVAASPAEEPERPAGPTEVEYCEAVRSSWKAATSVRISPEETLLRHETLTSVIAAGDFGPDADAFHTAYEAGDTFTAVNDHLPVLVEGCQDGR